MLSLCLMIAHTHETIDVRFNKRSETQIEYDLLTLQHLFRRTLDHSIEIPHRVHFNAVMIITEGSGPHWIDYQPYEYGPGTVLFIASHQVQQFVIRSEVRGYLQLFTDLFLYRLPGERSELLEMFDYMQFSPSMQLDPETFASVQELLKMLEVELRHPMDRYKERMLDGLFQTLLLTLKRQRSEAHPSHDEQMTRIYCDFKKAVFATHDYTRKVNEYADALAITPRTLSKVLHHFTGKSTKAYLDEWLLIQIKRALHEDKLTIREISDTFAFDEPTNMLKFFKRLSGETPSEFRSKVDLPQTASQNGDR